MGMKLTDIIGFRGDRLFNGAVNIDWFANDSAKTKDASEAFVFHGPKYHGVNQEDVGMGHGHRLIDTATLARSVVRRCYGLEDKPFTLAIAGYGTGKSHFGLTMASLLSAPKSKVSQNILKAIESADTDISAEIKAILKEAEQPCLAVALNGMRNFDLTAEVTKQIVSRLKADGHDSKTFDELRPRFKQAADLIRISKEALVKELLEACDTPDVEKIFEALNQQDELIYAKVHSFFAGRGMPIRALGGESLREVLNVATKEYCGKGKPYRSLLILFDEFGKYTEFATLKSQIAGSGALQDLFEAVQQAKDNSVCFVGFIQFELNAYVQRVAPEYKNEILRYVTRYQTADKSYLSINLETLIASLLEKRQEKLLDKWFDNVAAKNTSEAAMSNLGRWFPQSKNHRLWGDLPQFHSVIRKGCWPLSPYSTWLLFYLASAGKHLQERSALALLAEIIDKNDKAEVTDSSWSLSPAAIWSEALQHELISSEEIGQQGSITHAYASVIAKHGARLSLDLQTILRAVVLASKLGLKVESKEEATEALTELSGLAIKDTFKGLTLLQDEYNVLEWDKAFKAFDILGDAVPRTQFLAFVKQRVSSLYDEAGKGKLFASKAASWSGELLGDLDCDFAETNKISTREWGYQAVTSNLDFLPQQIKIAADRWKTAIGVDELRGTVVYVYVEQSRDLASSMSEAKRILKAAAKEAGIPALPILIVFLFDEDGALGQALAEYAVLEESVSDEDKAKFGNLIGAHKEKTQQIILGQIEDLIKDRKYVTGLKDELEADRLKSVASEVFTRIYKNPIPFPFDGFSTAKGNAADTCQELTMELFLGKLDYHSATAKPVKSKNRAITVLKDSWGIFSRTGDVSKRPTATVLRTITQDWDDALTKEEKRLPVAAALRQLCLPPYGANIASAGLLLGVFIAAREKKIIVARDGKQVAISQWIQDIFRGKFIDIAAADGSDLIFLGEESSEWQTFLDEWELAESHLARKNCLERANELKSRIPVPPALAYQENTLSLLAAASVEAIEKMDNDQNDAILKIENGRQKDNVSLLLWGAASLKKIYEKMENDDTLWTDAQIEEIAPHIEEARESVLQKFPMWLIQQGPRTESPDSVGEFKHKMIYQVGGNLKILGLTQQHEQLEERTRLVIKKAETIVEAHQLRRDVELWITQHGDVGRLGRLAEIRGLLTVGTEYARKLQGMAERVKDDPTISESRAKLSDFAEMLKKVEKEICKRANDIWNSKVNNEADMDRVLSEVEALEAAYENIPKDLEDFQLMRKALRLYEKCYQRLSDASLTWSAFESSTEEVRKDCEAELGKEELPWPYDEAIAGFTKDIAKRRKEASATWLKTLEDQTKAIETMPVADANLIHSQIETPLPVATDADLKRVQVVAKKVEARLDSFYVEWLIEKFKALSAKAKKEFIDQLKKLIGKSI